MVMEEATVSSSLSGIHACGVGAIRQFTKHSHATVYRQLQHGDVLQSTCFHQAVHQIDGVGVSDVLGQIGQAARSLPGQHESKLQYTKRKATRSRSLEGSFRQSMSLVNLVR